MNFETEIQQWIKSSLSQYIPTDVVALNFNLSENPNKNYKFAIDLIGVGSFDPHDRDWPCNEVWKSAIEPLDILTTYTTNDWEVCQHKLTALIKIFIDNDFNTLPSYRNIEAIGIAFVDGEIDLIYSKVR